MKNNKIHLSEESKNKLLTALVTTGVIAAFGFGATQSNPNIFGQTKEELDYNNSIDNKILKSARLIEIIDEKSNDVDICLCNVELSDDNNAINYKDIFKKQVVCSIPPNDDSITKGSCTMTDIGPYANYTTLTIVDTNILGDEITFTHSISDIKNDLAKISNERTIILTNKNNNQVIKEKTIR